eukprot:snap_masked-scaffold_5-processed-gene-15.36-mRNA-1 protein AED:1.00 eAED:1.00 QI:0/0/0/0/1/1/2/0/1386
MSDQGVDENEVGTEFPANIRQNMERTLRRIRQELRGEMQQEISKLGVQMNENINSMGEQLMSSIRDQIHEVMAPRVAQEGAPGQNRSTSKDSIVDEANPVYARESSRLLEMELKLKGYPVLENLEPEAVSKFLLSFQIFEDLVREKINKPTAYLQRCINIETLSELNLQEGVDTNSRESILDKLREIQEEDQSNRKARLLFIAKIKLKWKVEGGILTSMRAFVKKVSDLVQGLTISQETERNFCKIVIGHLPRQFLLGTAELTQDEKEWTTWKVTKAALLAEARYANTHFTLSNVAYQPVAPQRGINRIPFMSSQARKEPSIIKPTTTEGTQSKVTGGGKDRRLEMRKCFSCGEVGHLYRDCLKKNTKEIKTEGTLPHETAKFTATKTIGNVDILLTRSTVQGNEERKERQEQAKNVKLDLSWPSERRKNDTGDKTFACSIPGYSDYALKTEEVPDYLVYEDGNGPLEEEYDDYRTIFYDKELEVGIGENLEEEENDDHNRINEKLHEAMNRAEDLSDEQANEYFQVLQKHEAAFGDKVCKARMSTLNEMKVTMKPNVLPVRAAPRMMSSEKKEALREKLQLLEKNGIIERDPCSVWSSAAFMVPKASGGFRMVVNLRRLNERVEVETAILPAVEQQISWLPSDAKFFALFDCLSGFDLLKVDAESTKYFGISTIFGPFRLLGAPMGYVNTPTHYQERMVTQILGGIQRDALFGNPKGGVLQWVDDALVYAPTWPCFLKVIDQYLTNVRKYDVRLNVDKCNLFSTNVSSCGRILSEGQWRFEDKYFNRILNVNSPRTMGELEDVLYISICPNRTIPQLAELIENLAKLVITIKNEVSSLRGRKVNRKQRKGISLEQWWNQEYEESFQKLKKRIASAAKRNLSNYSSDKNVILVTDASKDYWSAILGLEEVNQDESDLTKVKFHPFYFLSGAYRGSSHNWGTPDKELFPVVRTIQKFRFLLDSHPLPIKLFTDHMNIVHLIKPERSLNLSTIGRLAIHVPTDQNKLADVLTRWGYCGEQKVEYDLEKERLELAGDIILEHGQYDAKHVKVKNSGKLDQSYVDFRVSFLQPDYTGNFKPIDSDSLKAEQKDSHATLTLAQKRSLIQDDEEVYIYKDTKKPWIPRPLIAHVTWMIHISHGHIGVENMLHYLSKYELFLTEDVKRDIVNGIKRSCLHCDPRGYYRRRRISEIVHGTKVNQVIHPDFLFVRNGYWLVLVEDVSRKILLVAAKRCTVDVFVKGLIRWKGDNGLAQNFHLVSDRGSHFVNKVVQRFKEYFPFQHSLGVSYSPWTNGSAEVTHQALLRYVKSLTSQYLLDHDSWHLLTEVIQAYANNKPRTDLGYKTPMEIFGGRQQDGTVIDTKRPNGERNSDALVFSVEGKLKEPLAEEKVI